MDAPMTWLSYGVDTLVGILDPGVCLQPRFMIARILVSIGTSHLTSIIPRKPISFCQFVQEEHHFLQTQIKKGCVISYFMSCR